MGTMKIEPEWSGTVPEHFDFDDYERELRRVLDADIELSFEAAENEDEEVSFSDLSHLFCYVAVETGGVIWGCGSNGNDAMMEGLSNVKNICGESEFETRLPLVSLPACEFVGQLCDKYGAIPYIVKDGIVYPAGITASDWAKYRHEPCAKMSGELLPFGAYVLAEAYPPGHPSLERALPGANNGSTRRG
jgi:hypothetical protein